MFNGRGLTGVTNDVIGCELVGRRPDFVADSGLKTSLLPRGALVSCGRFGLNPGWLFSLEAPESCGLLPAAERRPGEGHFVLVGAGASESTRAFDGGAGVSMVFLVAVGRHESVEGGRGFRETKVEVILGCTFGIELEVDEEGLAGACWESPSGTMRTSEVRDKAVSVRLSRELFSPLSCAPGLAVPRISNWSLAIGPICIRGLFASWTIAVLALPGSPRLALGLPHRDRFLPIRGAGETDRRFAVEDAVEVPSSKERLGDAEGKSEFA